MQADAVGEPDVGVGHRVVEAAAGRCREPGGQPPNLAVIAEVNVGALEPSTPIDPHLVGSVDQHVGDAGFVQQSFEWPGADQLTAQDLDGSEHLGRTPDAGLFAHQCGNPCSCRRRNIVSEPAAHFGDQGGIDRHGAAIGRQPSDSGVDQRGLERGTSRRRSLARPAGNVSDASRSRQNLASGPRP